MEGGLRNDVSFHDTERRRGDHPFRDEAGRTGQNLHRDPGREGRLYAHLILEFSQDGGVLNATTA